MNRGTFWRIVKERSTQEFDSVPYICVLLNATLWTYYGIIKPGAYLVATVNGFGALIQTIYLTIFLAFAPPKMKVKEKKGFPFLVFFFLLHLIFFQEL